MINPDICSCCGEIWNRQNLKKIPLGKYELHLCPDCYAEYIKLLDKIRTEIIGLTDGDIPERIWNADVLEIIDKYWKEQKEITEG